MSFGILPQCFHFGDGRFARRFPIGRQARFDVRESTTELRVGFPQRLLRIDFHEPGDVDDHEQQVADFILDFIVRSGFSQFV